MLSLTLGHSTDFRRSRGRAGEDEGAVESGGERRRAEARQGTSVGLVGPDAVDEGGGGGGASGTHYMFLGLPQMFEALYGLHSVRDTQFLVVGQGGAVCVCCTLAAYPHRLTLRAGG